MQSRENYLVKGDARSIYRWALARQAPSWPKEPREPLRIIDGSVRLTWLHHATCLLQFEDTTLLTDPIWAQRAGPLGLIGPKRHAGPLMALKDLPKIDAILLSHNHYDHMCLRTLKHFRGTPIITGRGNKAYLRGHRVVELDWWQTIPFRDVEITYTPSLHYSARTLWDRGRALWGSFVVDRVYFAADTAFGPHFAEIAARFPLDYALIPTGAFRPQNILRQYHMGPQEAMRAHDVLRVKKSIPIHHSTFQLGDEDWDEPLRLDTNRFVTN